MIQCKSLHFVCEGNFFCFSPAWCQWSQNCKYYLRTPCFVTTFFFQNINQELPACWADEFLSWYYRDDTFVKKILNSFNAKFDNESINFILLVWLMSYWITHNDTTELYKLQLWIEIYLDIVHHISQWEKANVFRVHQF